MPVKSLEKDCCISFNLFESLFAVKFNQIFAEEKKFLLSTGLMVADEESLRFVGNHRQDIYWLSKVFYSPAVLDELCSKVGALVDSDDFLMELFYGS
jgi:hypothetical protein